MLIGHRAHARLVVGVSAAPAGLTAARPAWKAPGAFCGCTSKGRTLSLYPLEKRRVGPLPRRRKTASRLCSSCCLTLWRTAAPRAASSTSPRRFRSFRPSSAAGTTRPGRPPRTNYLTQAIRCMYRELDRTLTLDGLAGVRQGVLPSFLTICSTRAFIQLRKRPAPGLFFQRSDRVHQVIHCFLLRPVFDVVAL